MKTKIAIVVALSVGAFSGERRAWCTAAEAEALLKIHQQAVVDGYKVESGPLDPPEMTSTDVEVWWPLGPGVVQLSDRLHG